MKPGLTMFAALFFVAMSSSGQTPRTIAGPCPSRLEAIQKEHDGKDSIELRQFLTFGGGLDCMTTLLLTQYRPTSIEALRETLIDRAQQVKTALQQNGASAGSGGSTSLVSKGMSAQMLSAAVEYGALTEATSGQTVTLSGSLGGVPAALIKQGILSNCGGINLPISFCVSDKTINNLNRLSYTVAFNTGTGSQSISGTTNSTGTSSAQPATFTASTNTVSSATGKFVLLRGAAASISDIAKAIDKPGAIIVAAPPQAQQTSDRSVQQTLANYDDLPSLKDSTTGWTKTTADKIVDGGQANAVANWRQQAASLMDAVCPPAASDADACRSKLLTDLGQYGAFVNSYKTGVNAFVEGLRKSPLLTFEYDYNRPASQPTNSTFRLVGQSVLGGWTMTLNSAASIYNSTPSSAIPDSSLLRDIQIAAESSYDFAKMKKSSILGHSTASAAFYFQDQTSPAILNVTPGQPASGVTITGLPSTATQVYAQKGKIGIGQGKFTYSPGSSSISIPISVTWSNRTELVTNSIWRGQVGISYDFDSLFGALKSK